MASDEGIRTNRAVFVGGLAQTVNETTLLQAFSTFGVKGTIDHVFF
jgi:hypothetical protein